MESQGLGHPLIFLDTAIIVGIKIRKFLIFIKRILFYVNTRGINVGAQDIHTRRNRLFPYTEQSQHL